MKGERKQDVDQDLPAVFDWLAEVGTIGLTLLINGHHNGKEQSKYGRRNWFYSLQLCYKLRRDVTRRLGCSLGENLPKEVG
jgi:hypothetical protein